MVAIREDVSRTQAGRATPSRRCAIQAASGLLKWDLLATRYPFVAGVPMAWSWLRSCSKRCAVGTLLAYAKGLEDFLVFAGEEAIAFEHMMPDDIARFVQWSSHARHSRAPARGSDERPRRVTNTALRPTSTLRVRLTPIRLFYDFACEAGVCERNPLRVRRRTLPAWVDSARTPRSLRSGQRIPWIPTASEWRALVESAAREPLRNRFMFALVYDAALRPVELRGLVKSDVDLAQRLLRLRAPCIERGPRGKGHTYTAPLSEATLLMAQAYLAAFRASADSSKPQATPLFPASASQCRDFRASIAIWDVIMRRIARRAGVGACTLRTLRYIRLLDAAVEGMGIRELSLLARARRLPAVYPYIELAERGAEGGHQELLTLLVRECTLR